MLKNVLAQLFERDLNKLIEEINLYNSDENLWRLDKDLPNSGGNLALHIVGNINHYFGANLGNTGYVRERDLEFSDKDKSREEIVERLEKTLAVLRETITNLPDEKFDEDYPEELGGATQKTLPVIIHLLTHLNYHLGQVNYHRRFFSV